MKIEWKTPKRLFEVLNEEFHFDFDVCALPWNAQCKHFFTPEDDGLLQKWNGVCWCNPPFDSMQGKWVKKAWEEAQRGCTVVIILPGNYHDSEWWHRYALKATEVRYMRGRPSFSDETGKKTSMRTIILVFHPFNNGPPICRSITKDGLNYS